MVSYTTLSQYTCTDPTACNYDPGASVNWPDYCEYPAEEYLDCDGSFIGVNGYPCWPACDCNGTYYDWNFDGQCTSEDLTIHNDLFDGNWIPSWPEQDQPTDIWDMPPHPQVNSVSQINQFMYSSWCNPVDVCISIDISGSMTGDGNRQQTMRQERIIIRQLLYSLYPGIVNGKIRISFAAWADMPGNNFPPITNDHIIYRLPQQLEGDIHFNWLIGITEMLFHDLAGDIPDAFHIPSGLGGLIDAGAGTYQFPKRGLEAAYMALNQPEYYDSNREQFIILITDAKWPYSYMDDAIPVANSIESGIYEGSNGANPNISADILGIIVRGGDNSFDEQDDYLHMIELTGESDGSDVAHLQNEIPFNPAPYPEPEVNSETGYIFGVGNSEPNDLAVIEYMSQITNVAENIAIASDGNCGCEGIIPYNNYIYPIVEIGDRCWFAEDLKTSTYNNLNAISINNDPEAWILLDTPSLSYIDEDYKFYNWYAVNTGNLCPSDWRVSNNSDWNNLESTLFNTRTHKLKMQSKIIKGYNLNTLTSLQFIEESFAVGLRENVNGEWRESETSIYWWTAEEYTPKALEFNRKNAAWARGINDSTYIITRDLWSTSNNKNNALKVRCVRDLN